MRAGVKVSLDEVKTDFERKGQQVNLEYVRFSNRKYEPAVVITDAELAELRDEERSQAARASTSRRSSCTRRCPKSSACAQILVKAGTGPNDPARAQRKADSWRPS